MRGLDWIEGRVEGVKSTTTAAFAGGALQPTTLLRAARVQEVKVRCPGTVRTTAAARANGIKAGRVRGFWDGMGLVGAEGAEEGAFERNSFTTLADERVGEEAHETTTAGRGVVGGCGLGVVEERDMVERGPGRREVS